MKAADAIGLIGHRIHISRAREARILFSWLGDLRGQRVLDVGGGDGYWAGQARRRGAAAFSVDLDPERTERGRRFTGSPILLRGDALHLPFAEGTFDAIMSVSSIEHFASPAEAISEMARVLRPTGRLVLSADSLAGSDRWPELAAAHKARYAVEHPLDHRQLNDHLRTAGFEPVRFDYMFKRLWTNRLFFALSRWRPAWNAAAPLSPLVSFSDRRTRIDSGSIILVHAKR